MSVEAKAVTLIRPASAMLETLALLLVAFALAAATLVFARANAAPEPNAFIADWQVSAFHDLSPIDQANYNALLFAGDTIQVWYDETYARQQPHWPTVEELSDPEFGVSPFMRDVSWKQGGQVQWQLIASYNSDGSTAYFGNRGKVAGQSAYLLLIAHLHKGASYRNQSIVWIHRDANAHPPATINVDSLVRNGWKQVVPYRGADEVKRLRGTG